MPDEKHEAGFKVVDRRSFAAEAESGPNVLSDTPPPPAAQPSPVEPPRIERPVESAQPDPVRDTSPRIEIPGGEEEFDVEGASQVDPGFETLVSYLGTTAMFQLGLMAGPSGERMPAELQSARQTVDMIEALQEKTRGNLTEDESHLLDDVLYELRMAYVEVEKRARPK
jgi:hypothetical protein